MKNILLSLLTVLLANCSSGSLFFKDAKSEQQIQEENLANRQAIERDFISKVTTSTTEAEVKAYLGEPQEKAIKDGKTLYLYNWSIKPIYVLFNQDGRLSSIGANTELIAARNAEYEREADRRSAAWSAAFQSQRRVSCQSNTYFGTTTTNCQ